MRAAFAACGADAAIVNAGSLRLNHDLPKGTTITRRHVEELMQFPAPLYLVELSGAQVQRAMENAISQPGAGRWLQVSGLAFVHDPSATPPRVAKLFVGPSGGRPAVDLMQHPEQRVRVVVNEYITRETAEGFVGILPPVAQALPCAASGTDLKALIFITLPAQGSIAPTAEGRICAVGETAHARVPGRDVGPAPRALKRCPRRVIRRGPGRCHGRGRRRGPRSGECRAGIRRGSRRRWPAA